MDESSARQLAETLGIKYFETSAKTGENVNEAVDALLEQVKNYTFKFFFAQLFFHSTLMVLF